MPQPTDSKYRHAVYPGKLPRRITWKPILAIIVLVAVTYAVSQGCQAAQVRVSQTQAIATAREQIKFDATRTQIRFVRAGFGASSYWAVSLSEPAPGGLVYKNLVIVKVNANSGQVAEVIREKNVKEEGLAPSPSESGPQASP